MDAATDASPDRNDGPSPDAELDGGIADECTRRCLNALARCGGSADCRGMCATYDALSEGCESERNALYDCAFDSACGTCSFVEGPAADALVGCITARNAAPCFAFCRAASAAGCALPQPDCDCVSAYYRTASTTCLDEVDAFYDCAAAAPCDRTDACATELAIVNSCALGCAPGEIGCYWGAAGTCVESATDEENCGGCGNACTDGTECREGRCACPARQIVCDGACADTQSDSAHCGGCGSVCATGSDRMECIAGACVPCGDVGEACCTAGTSCESPWGFVCEASVCVSCGNGGEPCCAAPYACVEDECPASGRCSCPADECAGVCTDTLWDAANCGACGRACTPYEACRMGVCEPQACTLVSPQRYCAAGEGCYVLSAMTGERDCFPAGTGLDAAPCAARNECAAGLQCYTLLDGTTACRRFCFWRRGDVDCVGGGRCTGLFGGTPDLMEVGLCVP